VLLTKIATRVPSGPSLHVSMHLALWGPRLLGGAAAQGSPFVGTRGAAPVRPGAVGRAGNGIARRLPAEASECDRPCPLGTPKLLAPVWPWPRFNGRKLAKRQRNGKSVPGHWCPEAASIAVAGGLGDASLRCAFAYVAATGRSVMSQLIARGVVANTRA